MSVGKTSRALPLSERPKMADAFVAHSHRMPLTITYLTLFTVVGTYETHVVLTFNLSNGISVLLTYLQIASANFLDMYSNIATSFLFTYDVLVRVMKNRPCMINVFDGRKPISALESKT